MLHTQYKLGFVVFPSISFFNSNCFLPPLSLGDLIAVYLHRDLYMHMLPAGPGSVGGHYWTFGSNDLN